MPFFPPSLAPDILARSFKASNGEIGVQAGDVKLFVETCKKDQCEVLGWELWLADHSWDIVQNRPKLVLGRGNWCGLVPESGNVPGIVYGGTGNADEGLSDIAKVDFESGDLSVWREFLRVNFTLV